MAESMYLSSVDLMKAYYYLHVDPPPHGIVTIMAIQKLCVCILLSVTIAPKVLTHSSDKILVFIMDFLLSRIAA